MFKAKGSPVSSGTATPTSSTSLDRQRLQEQSELVKDGLSALPTENDLQYEEMEKMSSVLPTMWLGSQTGRYTVKTCIARLCHIGHSFLKFSLILLNSERKICD